MGINTKISKTFKRISSLKGVTTDYNNILLTDKGQRDYELIKLLGRLLKNGDASFSIWRTISITDLKYLYKLLGMDSEISCHTCKHTLEFPLPYRCSVCLGMDDKEEYSLWEPK